MSIRTSGSLRAFFVPKNPKPPRFRPENPLGISPSLISPLWGSASSSLRSSGSSLSRVPLSLDPAGFAGFRGPFSPDSPLQRSMHPSGSLYSAAAPLQAVGGPTAPGSPLSLLPTPGLPPFSSPALPGWGVPNPMSLSRVETPKFPPVWGYFSGALGSNFRVVFVLFKEQLTAAIKFYLRRHISLISQSVPSIKVHSQFCCRVPNRSRRCSRGSRHGRSSCGSSCHFWGDDGGERAGAKAKGKAKQKANGKKPQLSPVHPF